MNPFPDVVRALVLPTAIEYPNFPDRAACADRFATGHSRNENKKDEKEESAPCLDLFPTIDYRDDASAITHQLCWTIDGAEPDGCHFWATPSFARNVPPLKIDVYVGGLSLCDAHEKGSLNPQLELLRLLEVHQVPLVDARLVGRLSVAKHICSALQHWAEQITGFERKYFDLPFGSYIAVEQLERDSRQMKCDFVSDHDLESRWLTMHNLQKMWSVPAKDWPRCLDHNNLRLVERVGDSIFLVELTDPDTGIANKYVFKSVTCDIKFMYHELRLLLNTPGHPNIQGRPLYIVVKRVRFGGKRGVCGFITRHLPMGSMLELLRNQALYSTTTIRQRVRWSRQLIEAMLHIRKSDAGFYSDLRASNVMLHHSMKGDAETDTLVIDFEQRTPWYSDAPPEIFWINLLERLAYGPGCSALQRDCHERLLAMNPNIQRTRRTDAYRETFAGSTAFMHLDPIEREKAMVFMVGKLIWRIFEGAPQSLDLISIDDLRGGPPTLSFPQFDATPIQLRALIEQCVVGPFPWRLRDQGLIIHDGHFVLRPSLANRHSHVELARALQREARSWWTNEVTKAKRYCNMRRKGSGIRANEMTGATQRPDLEELLIRFNELTADLRATAV